MLWTAAPLGAADLNCALRFSNGFVTDSYGMHEAAHSQAACLAHCETYGRESVEVMAGSDQVEVLEWTCLYERTPFFRKEIKPVTSEGYLVEPEPDSSGPPPEAAPPPTEEEIAANRALVGQIMAAQIAGQAAGMFTTHAMACADLDKTLTQAQLDGARKELSIVKLDGAREELSIVKEDLVPEAQLIWDQYFQLGEREEIARGTVYDQENCAGSLELLRRQPR